MVFVGGFLGVLSLALEPISKSTVHDLARRVSMVKIARKPRYRRCIAVDEAKLFVKGVQVYVWSAVDVDSRELLALEASYGRSSLNALAFLKKALRMCTNKLLVIVDRGPWYRWAFERLGLKYRHEGQGREALQTPKGENCSIPPQDEREKPRTGNKEPKAIPKPIRAILPGREDRRWVKMLIRTLSNVGAIVIYTTCNCNM
jgi:transposase-like protein